MSLEQVRDALAKEVLDQKIQNDVPILFKELGEQARPKLFLKP
jgi:hypothetical protein